MALARASVTTVRGERAATHRLLLEALARYETLNDRIGMARCHYGLGNLQIGAGDYEEAFDYLDRAHADYERLGNARGQANCHVNRGLAALHLGRYGAAEESTEQALRAFQLLHDDFGMASVLTNLGRIATQRGRFTTARVHFIRARQMAERVGDQNRVLLIRYFETEADRLAGALNEAAAGYAALLQDVQQRQMTGYVLFFLPGTGRCLAAGGEHAAARAVLSYVTGHESADHYARWQAALALDELVPSRACVHAGGRRRRGGTGPPRSRSNGCS